MLYTGRRTPLYFQHKKVELKDKERFKEAKLLLYLLDY